MEVGGVSIAHETQATRLVLAAKLRQTIRCPVPVRSTLALNPPKARLPGKGASCPSHGGGGSPFEPGRVRGTHSSTGGVGVPIFVVVFRRARSGMWGRLARVGLWTIKRDVEVGCSEGTGRARPRIRGTAGSGSARPRGPRGRSSAVASIGSLHRGDRGCARSRPRNLSHRCSRSVGATRGFRTRSVLVTLSLSRVGVEVSQAPAELTRELSLLALDADELWIVGVLKVRVVSLVAAAVGVDQRASGVAPSTGVLRIRRLRVGRTPLGSRRRLVGVRRILSGHKQVPRALC